MFPLNSVNGRLDLDVDRLNAKVIYSDIYLNLPEQEDATKLVDSNGVTIINTANSIIDCNNNKIINLSEPTADLDGSNKKYVDDQIALIDNTKLYDDNSNIIINTSSGDAQINGDIKVNGYIVGQEGTANALINEFQNTRLRYLDYGDYWLWQSISYTDNEFQPFHMGANLNSTNSRLNINNDNIELDIDEIKNNAATYDPYFDDFQVKFSSRKGSGYNKLLLSTNENTSDKAVIYLGTMFNQSSSAPKCALIAEGRSDWSTSNFHICLNNNTGTGTNDPDLYTADVSDAVLSCYTSNGTVRIQRGPLDMNTNNKIINLATPTADADATTKKYVDDNILWENGGLAIQLKTAMPISLQSNKIEDLATPLLDTDAATKGYVDNNIISNKKYGSAIIDINNNILNPDGDITITSVTRISTGVVKLDFSQNINQSLMNINLIDNVGFINILNIGSTFLEGFTRDPLNNAANLKFNIIVYEQ